LNFNGQFLKKLFLSVALSEEDARKRLRKTARNSEQTPIIGDSSSDGGNPSKAKSGSDPNVGILIYIYLSVIKTNCLSRLMLP